MASNEIVQQVYKELCVSYAASGKFAPDALPAVAETFAEAIGFSNAEEVHYIFKKARDIEAIPTQATLKQCWKNYSEEFLKYQNRPSEALQIGMEADPRGVWLPDTELKRALNRKTAVKNYCIALDRVCVDGVRLYKKFCELHTHHAEGDRENKKWVLDHPAESLAFDTQMFKEMQPLYVKYLRSLPKHEGFPKDAKLNFALTPPTINEFVWMLKQEIANG